MRTTAQPVERLAIKSDRHTLAHNLITRYNMSIAEADCLTHELRQKSRELAEHRECETQIWGIGNLLVP